jgi:hypothetical protein
VGAAHVDVEQVLQPRVAVLVVVAVAVKWPLASTTMASAARPPLDDGQHLGQRRLQGLGRQQRRIDDRVEGRRHVGRVADAVGRIVGRDHHQQRRGEKVASICAKVAAVWVRSSSGSGVGSAR